MPNKLTDGIRDILAQQGMKFEGSDDDLTVALGQAADNGRKDLFEQFPDFADDYRAIREANSPGTIGGLVNTGKNAFDRSRQAFSAIGGIGDGAAENIAEAERRIQGRASSVPWEDWQKSDGLDALKVFARDPVEILSNIVVSGFTGSLPALAGGVTGGAAASAASGPGAVLAGPIGAAVGTGAGSLAVEYGNKYLDVLREAGADLSDPESIKRVVADPAVQEKARNLGLRRGLPVAAFDALSAGLAGKFLKGVSSATIGQNVRHGLAEAAIQGSLGGAGEVAGALSAGEDISPRAVFEEVVGELGPGAVEVGGAALRRRMAERGLAPTPNARPAATPNIAPAAPNAAAVAPIATPAPITAEAISPARRVASMTDEERAARVAELSAQPSLTPDEQQEMELLSAMVAQAQPKQSDVGPSLDLDSGLSVAQPSSSKAQLDAIRDIATAAEMDPEQFSMLASEEASRDLFRNQSVREYQRIADIAGISEDEAASRKEEIADNVAAMGPVQRHINILNEAINSGLPVNRAAVDLYNSLPNKKASEQKYREAVAYLKSKGVDSDWRAQFQRDYPAFTLEGTKRKIQKAREQIGDYFKEHVVVPEYYQQVGDFYARPDMRGANSENSAATGVSYGVGSNEEQSGITPPVAATPEPLAPASEPASPAAFATPASGGQAAVPSETPSSETGLSNTTPPETVTGVAPTGGPVSPEISLVPTETLPSGEPAPAVPEMTDVPAAPQPSPTLEDRLRKELNRPEPFAFGAINEGSGITVDLREDPRFENLTPEMAKRLPVTDALDTTGNRAKTRVAVVLESPDGRYVQAGLLVPQEMSRVGAAGERETGPAVQSMAAERRAGGYQKLIKEGGNRPALLSDVIAAGYKLRAIVHFNAEPGSIFQRFPSREAFDASYAATERTNASSAAAKTAPTLSAAQGVERRNVREQSNAIQSRIDALANELETADPARAAEINEEITGLYRQLGELPQLSTASDAEGIDSTSAAALAWENAAAGELPAALGEQLAEFERGLNRSVPRGEPRYRLTPQTLRANLLQHAGRARGQVASAGMGADSAGHLRGLIDGLRRVFGKTLVFVDPGIDTPVYAFTKSDRANTIFINTRGEAPIVALVGHEFGHNLQAQRPELWSQLRALVAETNPMPENYRALKESENYSVPEEEWVNDILGQQFDEPEFWQEVGRVSQERGMGAQFRQIVENALAWLTGVARRIRMALHPDAAAPMLAEINRVRQAMAEALVEFARNAPYPDNPDALRSADADLSTVGASTQPELPAQADRANQFQAVVARLRQSGAQVDVFARTFLQEQLGARLNAQLESLIERYQNAPESAQPGLQAAIERAQADLAALDRVKGVTYSPQHIAVGLQDLQTPNLGNLVTLLHEVGHAVLADNPEMQGRVVKAVNAAMADLTAENVQRTATTGSTEAKTANPEELIVQTLGQRLAEEGIPDSPSLARALWQWVKDLYYRLAMGVQASFGREPNPQLALDWLENQVRRLTGGDYDYRFGSLLGRLMRPTIDQEATHQTPMGGTPSGMTNFFDATTDGVRQPTVLPDTARGVDWNLRFSTEAEPSAKELEIPHAEAMARIQAAAINEEAEIAEQLYAAARAKDNGLAYEQWWASTFGGETPKARLSALDQLVPGSAAARIGGENMTEAMTGLARVQAKALLMGLQNRATTKLARSEEMGRKAEGQLVQQAKRVNKLEGDLRNAEMHEANFREQLKTQIQQLVKDYRAAIGNAEEGGALAQAVRDAEGLAEGDPLPKEYEEVFRRVMADEVPLFSYVDAIAQLDLPLADLTAPEFYSAVQSEAASNETLARLVEPRNRPLLVALRVLTKANAEQVDMLRLRRAAQEEFLKVHGELAEIRRAPEASLRKMEQAIREDRRAATYADRLKRSYIEKRAKLRKLQTTIQRAEENRGILTAAQAAVAEKIDALEVGGLAAPSEWQPNAGETYLAMQQDESGKWQAARRKIEYTREGPPVNAAQMQQDLAANRRYLKENRDRAGSKTYQLVERQTQELSAQDFNRKYPEVKRLFFEKWLLPSADLILSGGGAGAARAARMLKKFQAVMFSNYESDIHKPAVEWANRLADVTKAAGLKDQQAFLDQVYDPVLYFIQTEPGLEEGPALREAVRAARRRLTTEPTEAFDEKLKDFLRRTKALSDNFVKIAEDQGLFVEDKKLGGELRRAVSRGWLTVLRRMNAGVVQTVLHDMDKAGWRLEFADGEQKAPDSFERGAAAGKRVVRSTTFDALMPDLAATDDQRAQIAQVLEDPGAFAQAISGFFPAEVVNRWLAPFVNKPGEPVFSNAQGEKIEQLDAQAAWQRAGGDVAQFIEQLGKSEGYRVPEEGDPHYSAKLSPEASWRVDMLRQLAGLHKMESKIAADSVQVKGLFDPQGRPAHLMMDARENDLLPPEHIQHMGFDPTSARNLLATLAFHAAFGRNGSGMESALQQIKSELAANVSAFQSLRGSTTTAKKANAKARGLDYATLRDAAKVMKQVEAGEAVLRAQFGFGNPAGQLGDIKGGLELLHFIATQTTNTPKTGLLNLLQATQRPVARRTLDPVALRDTARAGSELVKTFFGQQLESFGLHLVRASEHAKEIGAAQGQGVGRLPWTETLGIGSAGKRGEQPALPVRALRTAGALQRKGARIGFGESREFPRAANVPFLSNVMQGLGLDAAISNGTAEATSIESLVKAAMDYFAAHPEALNDPTFRLTAKDLRAQSAAWFNSPGSFDYFRRAMVDYGIGNLEDVARDAMERAQQAQPILTKEQVLKAAMMSNNELDLQGSINTNPGSFAANPVLKFATPLLGYPLRAMNQVHSLFREADGRASAKAALKAAGILAAWSLPVGLAFTFLTDEYDDKLLKKKSGLPSIGGNNTAEQNVAAVLQRVSRAGNIYGLGADFLSSQLSGLDPTSGQRAFSLDSRVLAFSQLRTLTDAISTYLNNGYEATYAGVERPLIQFMGGNGALQAVQIFNNVLGLDNAEARLTARTNAQQWLRTAGREVGVELARSGGAAVVATPVGTWTREMYLAALANDRLGYLDAYRRAVDAARESGAPDPEAKVRESWRSRSPLEVFRTKPTEFEIQRMLAAMSDDGRTAVRDALRLFDQYSSLIAPTAAERYERQQLSQLRRGPADFQALRRQMAGASLSFR